MLKGISMQLNAISTYLQSQLHVSEHTWDTFLLNTEKNTSEMLKLTRIAFTELDEYLPRDVGQAFDRAAGLLRKYFKNRPKGEVEQEEQREYRMEYDEVQHFLDNKPEIVTNDEERGELFKFLTMNEQKQKNTQILLESMPRYSLDYAYHPTHPNRNKSTMGIDTPKFTNTNLPEITKNSLKNSGNSLFKPQSKLTRTDSKSSSEFKEAQVQTDLTFDFIKSMLAQYQALSLQNGGSIEDFTSQINNHMQEIVKRSSLKKHQESNQGARASEGQQQFESNKQKNNQIVLNEKRTVDQSNHINQAVGMDQGNLQVKIQEKTSASLSTKKIATKQQSSVKISTQKSKKNPDKRQSSNSLSSSKKDILKGVSTKRQARRSSKDLKEQLIKQTNESKFSKQSKQKKSHSPSRYVTTILQTTQEMANSTSYQVTPPDQPKMKESEINNQDIVLINSLHQQSTQLAPKNDEENSSMLKRFSKKSNGQREKLLSNKQQPIHSDFLIEQAYACTATHAFYRKPSEKAESSLPKIEQRGKPHLDRAESLKKKIYQSSPYAKALLQSEQKQMKYSNSSSQLNHRSLHLNSSDYSFLSPKDTNISKYHRTQLVNEASQDYKNSSSFRFDQPPKIAQCDRQNLLREQHNRFVRQIEESVSRKAHPQWTKVIRSIRHYELMHASLCGENCVHLSKFYQFLKKKNLGNCINRKELFLHKKNIQINTNL